MDLSRKLIIDTDCGVDDALAIMYSLCWHCEVAAFTCVTGNTTVHNACDNVHRVLNVCQRNDIPVYKGCSDSLCGKTSKAEEFHGSDGLGGVAHKYPVAKNETFEEHASMAMIRLAKKRPKELTLVMIGPLTNAALAHHLDSSFTENLKEIVCFGGNVEGIGNSLPGSEFNFMADPEAAHLVISEAKCPITLVPWETNLKCPVPWDLFQVWANTDTCKGRFCQDITDRILREYYKTNPAEGFHLGDILALIAILRPDSVVKAVDRRVSVELSGKHTRGQMVQAWYPEMLKDVKRTVRIVTELQKDLVWELFMRIL